MESDSKGNIISINKIKLSQFTKKGEKEEIEYIFYDRFSKRLIQILKENVKIFNRTGTSLKKDIMIILPSSYIHMVCVDKETNYMLILVQVRDKTKMIPGINLKTQCVIDMLKGDFNYLLGMFFITTNNFCLVFSHKLVFFRVEPSDEIKEILTIKISSDNILIQNYDFSQHFKILCLLRTDNTFDIYNLSNVQFYKHSVKNFSLSYTLKEIDYEMGAFNGGIFSSLFNTESKLKKAQNKINLNYHTSSILYSKSQFFLASLYTKLYFIYLCYEDGKIHLMRINNLSSFPSDKDTLLIDYKNHNKNSTLQFIDNLILVYNFTKKEVLIIDINLKNENKILCTCKSNLFPNEKVYINGGMIEEVKNKVMHYVKFDNLAYYMQYPSSQKHIALINITRRKNSKDLVIDMITEMLSNKSSYKAFNVRWVFEEIAKENKALIDMTVEIAKRGQEKSEKKQKMIPAILELFTPPDVIMLSKKATLTQMDIFILVFKTLLESTFTSDDDFCIRILIYMKYFYCFLNDNDIPVIQNFYYISYCFIKKIKDKNKLLFFFYMNPDYPDSYDLALYLINNEDSNEFLMQIGIDMLYKEQKYFDIFKHLIKTNQVNEAMLFLDRNLNKMDKTEMKDIKWLLSSIVKTNKRILYDYITI